MALDFVAHHDRVYVLEQNRDGQVYRLLRSELNGTLDDRLISLTHYSGTPMGADHVVGPILDWEKNFAEHSALTEQEGNEKGDAARGRSAGAQHGVKQAGVWTAGTRRTGHEQNEDFGRWRAQRR